MNAQRNRASTRQRGLSLVEVLISFTIAAVLLTGLQAMFSSATRIESAITDRAELDRQARFAMARIHAAINGTNRLILPLGDRTGSNWPENLREQTVPPSPPVGDSTLATAVLAVALPGDWDIDLDGVVDADNDGDGRIDEDWPADMTADGDNGVLFIDDDGDGSIDEGFLNRNDDEYLFSDDDRLNGVDDDNDGSIDEDTPADMNGDGQPGIAGVDDDGDGNTDEGDDADDDEDGSVDEDWLDTVVFYVQGSDLIERRSVPWDTNSDSAVTGADFVESTIAENLTHVRFERLVGSSGVLLVDVTLSLTSANGETVTRNRRLRVAADQ